MKKVLPMEKPIIRAYANHAHVYSILGAHSDQHLPWVYNYYVQLYVPFDMREFKVDYLLPGIYKHTPNLMVSRLDRKTGFSVKENVISAIKHYIENGYYIYTLLEVSNIAAYNNTYHITHDPLIYGYDDERKEIYFADTYINGKYGYGVASYDEIIQAIGTESQWREWNEPDRLLDVLCMKYREDSNSFIFSKEMYIKLLNDYVKQNDSFDNRWKIAGVTKKDGKNRVCGVGVYSYLQDYLNLKRRDKSNLDKRGFYVIWEHKIILDKALYYILGKQWKEQYPSEAKMLIAIIEKAEIMLNLCLKYNMTKEEKLLSRITQLVDEMEKGDKLLVTRLIKIIDKSG